MASRPTRSHIPLPLAPRMESLPTTDGSSDDHTDPWIDVSHPLLYDPTPIRHSRNISGTKSEGWNSSTTTGFGVKSIEPVATGKSNMSVKDRIAQVQAHARSRSQADLLPPRSGGYKPKDKHKENGKDTEKKLPKVSSKGSLSRRASAPLLGSFGTKKRGPQVKPIDTSSRSYVRPGITPPTTSRPTSPAGQLSTFGTVYVPPWDNSRAESDIPRPATAPLPAFHFRDLAPTSPSEQATDDEAVGGVHYSTYGSRASQIYDDSPFASTLPPNMPFSSAIVPIPPSLLDQSETKTIHKRGSSQTLTALLRRGKNGRADSPGPDESLASQDNPRSPTFSVVESGPTRSSTPGLPGGRPTTPAVPDFLAASRAEGDESGDSTPPATAVPRQRLRARSSLLALAAAAVSGSGNGSGSATPRSPDSSRAESASTQRPLSVLARLAAHFTVPGSSGPQDESFPRQSNVESTAQGDESLSSWQDESFTSGPDESIANGGEFGVLPDLGELEPFGMMVQGSLSTNENTVPMPTSSEKFPSSSVPVSPPRPRLRTLSRLSATSRKMFNKVDSAIPATFSGRSSTRRRTLSVFSNASMSSRKPRSMRGEGKRFDSVTRRTSADALSAEGGIEGTVMYGVGEEMLRLMFGGALPPPAETQQAPTTHAQINADPEQAPTSLPRERERERTRSLPRRVSVPKPRVDLAAAFTPPASHEAQLLPDFGGPPDLRFSNPTRMTPPASAPISTSNSNQSHNQPRRKGHKRGAGSKSKENVSVGTLPVARTVKSRSRSKSAPLGVSADLQTSLGGPKQPMGILTNGKRAPSPGPGRVVIVNSAVTPSLGSAGAAMGGQQRERRRQTTRSNPMPVGGSSTEGTPDTSLSVDAHPGIVITAPTPPAPRRSMTAPLDGGASAAEFGRMMEASESARGTVSRGTSVQFVPESLEGPRRARLRREASSGITSMLSVGEGSGSSKGKRKVEKDGPDVADPGLSSPPKKQRLSEEDLDITFMGEPLFGGVPQRSRSGHGSVDASSHYSKRSYNTNPRHSYPNQHANSPNPYPSPAASPEPERSTIPMRAIVSPRVQSLHGHGSDYATRRQSIGSIQRPKSRASARSNVTGGRSNGTGARSQTSSARGKRSWKDRLPLQGWCFILGFFMPLIWWYAAFSRAERGYYGGGVWSRDVEAQWEGVKTTDRDDGRIDAHTWRFRCRLMAAFSLVIYVPVIVLAAVFAR